MVHSVGMFANLHSARNAPDVVSSCCCVGCRAIQLHTAYVIMIAGAHEIAASAIGLVYFCAIGPTILVKLFAPYW